MKWKRIKCFLTGGHRLYDKNLQTIHDTNGYHFINYCVKCGKVFAAFMAEAELNGLIDRDIEQFRKERLMKVGDSLILSSSSSNELGDKGDKGECFCKDFFQIGVF